MLQPGDSHFYDVGVVHSPKGVGLTMLVSIEGANLDHVKRSNIKAAKPQTQDQRHATRSPPRRSHDDD